MLFCVLGHRCSSSPAWFAVALQVGQVTTNLDDSIATVLGLGVTCFAFGIGSVAWTLAMRKLTPAQAMHCILVAIGASCAALPAFFDANLPLVGATVAGLAAGATPLVMGLNYIDNDNPPYDAARNAGLVDSCRQIVLLVAFSGSAAPRVLRAACYAVAAVVALAMPSLLGALSSRHRVHWFELGGAMAMLRRRLVFRYLWTLLFTSAAGWQR